MFLMAVASFGRNHISKEAIIVADTLFYSQDRTNVSNRSEASYYRLLKQENIGATTRDVFQDFYTNGALRAEGGYTFIDLGNDKNTVLDGEIRTYYQDGKEKWHGFYKNGKRNGYFTLQMTDGSVAVAQFENGKSKFNYFTVTRPDGTTETRSVKELESLL